MSKIHVITLTKDQDVTTGIHNYLMNKDMKAAVIVGGVGSVYDVVLRNPGNYEMPPTLIGTNVNSPCEVVSFMGEITRKEDAPADMPCTIIENSTSPYMVHIHAAFSHGDGIVNGGGFATAKVLRAINIYVLEINE